ncbi:MAG: phosphoglucomutase/phosphomannomutase family protein [Anaerolineae bacterium]
MTIKFGTDGWRAVISDEFTFANVRHVAQAIADFLLEEGGGRTGVVVGFDTRFLSDRYAIEVARVLAGNGIAVHLSKADCPTAALSYAVKALDAAGGVMITASHNPPRYNGIKCKAYYGGPAMPEMTKQMEAHLVANLEQGRESQTVEYEQALADGSIVRFDLLPGYLDHVRSLIDLERIAHFAPQVVVDPIYGAGRGYIKQFLEEAGLEVTEIHNEMNPGFGGLYPEPIARNLGDLIATVTGSGCDIGLATDGDADRIGAVDAQGNFIDPHRIFTLVLRHLVEERHQRGDVVKTVSTTKMVDILCLKYGLRLHETPVGFSYICDLMLHNDVLIGGEESGGITIRGHIPEGDGILMGLLLLEVMATHELPIHVIIRQLMDEIGYFHFGRHDLETKPFNKAELVASLMAHVPASAAGLSVVDVRDNDGVKYLLEDESWLLIRPSGTEPVLRIYAEARSREGVGQLLEQGAGLVGL